MVHGSMGYLRRYRSGSVGYPCGRVPRPGRYSVLSSYLQLCPRSLYSVVRCAVFYPNHCSVYPLLLTVTYGVLPVAMDIHVISHDFPVQRYVIDNFVADSSSSTYDLVQSVHYNYRTNYCFISQIIVLLNILRYARVKDSNCGEISFGSESMWKPHGISPYVYAVLLLCGARLAVWLLTCPV